MGEVRGLRSWFSKQPITNEERVTKAEGRLKKISENVLNVNKNLNHDDETKALKNSIKIAKFEAKELNNAIKETRKDLDKAKETFDDEAVEKKSSPKSCVNSLN